MGGWFSISMVIAGVVQCLVVALERFDDQCLDSDADVEYILEETRERIQEWHSQNQKLNCLSVIVRI